MTERITTRPKARPRSEPDQVPLVAPYESWTVATLRAALAERGLSTAGRKAELVARLRDAHGIDGAG